MASLVRQAAVLPARHVLLPPLLWRFTITGPDTGDRLLRVYRLKSVGRADNLVVRLGGDELAVRFPGAPRRRPGASVASTWWRTDATSVRLSPGWSRFPKGSRRADVLAAASDG